MKMHDKNIIKASVYYYLDNSPLDGVGLSIVPKRAQEIIITEREIRAALVEIKKIKQQQDPTKGFRP